MLPGLDAREHYGWYVKTPARSSVSESWVKLAGTGMASLIARIRSWSEERSRDLDLEVELVQRDPEQARRRPCRMGLRHCRRTPAEAPLPVRTPPVLHLPPQQLVRRP